MTIDMLPFSMPISNILLLQTIAKNLETRCNSFLIAICIFTLSLDNDSMASKFVRG